MPPCLCNSDLQSWHYSLQQACQRFQSQSKPDQYRYSLKTSQGKRWQSSPCAKVPFQGICYQCDMASTAGFPWQLHTPLYQTTMPLTQHSFTSKIMKVNHECKYCVHFGCDIWKDEYKRRLGNIKLQWILECTHCCREAMKRALLAICVRLSYHAPKEIISINTVLSIIVVWCSWKCLRYITSAFDKVRLLIK